MVTDDGKICVVRDGWLLCPSCGRSKVLRVHDETWGRNIQVYCKKCGRESLVNIDQCQCHKSQCQ